MSERKSGGTGGLLAYLLIGFMFQRSIGLHFKKMVFGQRFTCALMWPYFSTLYVGELIGKELSIRYDGEKP